MKTSRIKNKFLSYKPGDILQLLDRIDIYVWEGKNLRTKEKGMKLINNIVVIIIMLNNLGYITWKKDEDFGVVKKGE